jgi:hypothetical protein
MFITGAMFDALVEQVARLAVRVGQECKALHERIDALEQRLDEQGRDQR